MEYDITIYLAKTFIQSNIQQREKGWGSKGNLPVMGTVG